MATLLGGNNNRTTEKILHGGRGNDPKNSKDEDSKKLMICFIIVAIIGSISGVVSVTLLKVVDIQYSEALIDEGFVQGHIGKLIAALGQVNSATHDVVSYLDTENRDKARERYNENVDKVEPYLAQVEKSMTTDEEDRLFAEIEQLWSEYYDMTQSAVAIGVIDLQATKDMQQRMEDELLPLYDELYGAIAELMEVKVVSGTDQSTALTKVVLACIIIVIALIVVAFVTCILIGRKIAAGIAEPINSCVERLEKIAVGDFHSPVPEVDTEDEVKSLADAMSGTVNVLNNIITDVSYLLGEMAGGKFNIRSRDRGYYMGDTKGILESIQLINSSLIETLKDIGGSSEQVAIASGQLAEGATALAEGATDQASAIQELLATVTEVTERVEETADSAGHASENAVSVGKQTERSSEQMDLMTTAMERISDTSKQIAEIINSIDAIAAQTNLLSLNAAIEAARAGEAGKGFAVVAEEIRELSNQSSIAANNTRALIQTSISEVERGNEIVTETGESLNVVTEGVRTIVATVEAAKDAMIYQATAMEQINQGITQISQVVQNNSATAEENSATSEELAANAENLNVMVAKFELG